MYRRFSFTAILACAFLLAGAGCTASQPAANVGVPKVQGNTQMTTSFYLKSAEVSQEKNIQDRFEVKGNYPTMEGNQSIDAATKFNKAVKAIVDKEINTRYNEVIKGPAKADGVVLEISYKDLGATAPKISLELVFKWFRGVTESQKKTITMNYDVSTGVFKTTEKIEENFLENEPNPDDTASAEQPGDFGGSWTWENPPNAEDGFDLDLVQDFEVLRGYHCGVFQNGNRIDCLTRSDASGYSLEGTIIDGVATVEFTSQYGYGKGTATLKRDGDKLIWEITRKPFGPEAMNSQYYLPDKAIMIKFK